MAFSVVFCEQSELSLSASVVREKMLARSHAIQEAAAQEASAPLQAAATSGQEGGKAVATTEEDDEWDEEEDVPDSDLSRLPRDEPSVRGHDVSSFVFSLHVEM